MSNDVVWSIIRNNSSYLLKKRNCPKPFSSEPMNLTNLNSKRYSGLANSKAISIAPPSGTTKGFQFSIKKGKQSHRPKQQLKTTLMKTGPRTSLHKVKRFCMKQRYRKDLAKAAMRRASAIIRSQKPLPAVKGAKKTNKKVD